VRANVAEGSRAPAADRGWRGRLDCRGERRDHWGLGWDREPVCEEDGCLHLIAPVADFQAELPAFEAHEHAPHLVP
jgi:hypothetical protein